MGGEDLAGEGAMWLGTLQGFGALCILLTQAGLPLREIASCPYVEAQLSCCGIQITGFFGLVIPGCKRKALAASTGHFLQLVQNGTKKKAQRVDVAP